MILVILSAAVLGRLGDIHRVMVGAMLIGLSLDLSATWLPPAYRFAAASVAVIIATYGHLCYS